MNLLKWDERLIFLVEEDKYLRINHLFSNVASHVIFRDDNSFLKQNCVLHLFLKDNFYPFSAFTWPEYSFQNRTTTPLEYKIVMPL